MFSEEQVVKGAIFYGTEMREICSIIVIYEPDKSVKENILSILSQSSKVILVDNTEYFDERYLHLDELLIDERIILIRDGTNLGIAGALNKGIEASISMGYKWVATFDQDSSLPYGYFQILFENYDLHPERHRIRIISPIYRDKFTRKLISPGRNVGFVEKLGGLPYEEVNTTITSGNLIDIRVFEEIGKFREDLFIDLVDHDFCLRCVNRGYKILEVSKAILDHQLGSPTIHVLLTKKISVTNHSPLRRYYMARNRIYLYRTFALTNKTWAVKDMQVFFLKEIPKIILFEKEKLTKVKKIIQGFYDGFNNKYGRY